MSDLPTRIREHAKHVTGVLVEQDLNRAANEIERLRSRNIETVYQENRALEAEIDRLRVADSAKSKYIKELRVVNRALNDAQTNNLKRIEGLKEQSSYWENIAFNLALGREETSDFLSGHHIITTGQIRAAWGVFTKSRQAIRPFNVLDFEGVFGQLGIFRCECEREIDHWTEGEGSMTTVKCPDCNGDGFKIGGEDE